MKDFSVLWAGDYVSVVSPDDAPYEALHEKDMVQVLPIDVATSELFTRREVCPPYMVKDANDYTQFQTVLSGGIEDGETPKEVAIREVSEELGIDLANAEYEFVQLTPDNIPYTKSNTARVTIFLLMLFKFEQSEPEGDGTPYEEISTFERIPIQEIDERLRSDQCDFLLHAAVAMMKNFILLDQK